MKKLNRANFIKSGVTAVASLAWFNASARTQMRSAQSAANVEQKLKEMGLSLPQAPKPVGAYVATRRSGNLLFISVQLPFVQDKLLYAGGKVGRELTIEQGQAAFRTCALNVLAQAKQSLENLGKVSGIVKIVGYLCCTEGFADHAKVLNGASEFFVAALGAEKGAHTRVVMGVQSLPMGAPVALEAIMETMES